MAVTTEGIDKAVITRCVVLDRERLADGSWAQTEKALPWVFVKFADDSETNRYVMPASNGLPLLGAAPFREAKEAMRASAFPHETDFGPTPSSGDQAKAGPRAVHFFASSL